MNLVEALGEAESAEPASALFVLAEEAERLRALLGHEDRVLRSDERERLAQWFTSNADELRSFAADGLTVEFICFLLRLNHDA